MFIRPYLASLIAPSPDTGTAAFAGGNRMSGLGQYAERTVHGFAVGKQVGQIGFNEHQVHSCRTTIPQVSATSPNAVRAGGVCSAESEAQP